MPKQVRKGSGNIFIHYDEFWDQVAVMGLSIYTSTRAAQSKKKAHAARNVYLKYVSDFLASELGREMNTAQKKAAGADVDILVEVKEQDAFFQKVVGLEDGREVSVRPTGSINEQLLAEAKAKVGSGDTRTTIGQVSFGSEFFNFEDEGEVKREVSAALQAETEGTKGRAIRDADGNILLGRLTSSQIRSLMGNMDLQLTRAAKKAFETKTKFIIISHLEDANKGRRQERFFLFEGRHLTWPTDVTFEPGGSKAIRSIVMKLEASKINQFARRIDLKLSSPGTIGKLNERFVDFIRGKVRASNNAQNLVTMIYALLDEFAASPAARTPVESIFKIESPPVVKLTGKKERRSKTKQRRRGGRGKFISNVQLSAILQKRLAEVMPRKLQPQRPTPRYVTGRLARSFQLMANYRAGLMGFYNTPPASGYVDQLNTSGWMLDKTLVEPTIRQITQQLFGRQFRVLRTQ